MGAPVVTSAAQTNAAYANLRGSIQPLSRFRCAVSCRVTLCCAVLCHAQVGDILDRGDQELKLLYLLERLQRQAAAAGGALWVLNGNHETMNVGGNFRYATQGGRKILLAALPPSVSLQRQATSGQLWGQHSCRPVL